MDKKKNSKTKRKNKIFIGDNLKQYKAQEINNIEIYILNHGDGMIEKIDEDLFNLSKNYCLAHSVAEDLQMGAAGIAVDFKCIFSGIGRLVDQKLKVGEVGIVQHYGQFAFYLVTKKYSNGIPKIGCGLDKLNWSDTRSLIVDIFSGSGIDITVCVLSKIQKHHTRLNVHITPSNLWEMATKTFIVLFIDLKQVCKNNWKDHVVDKVDTSKKIHQKTLKIRSLTLVP